MPDYCFGGYKLVIGLCSQRDHHDAATCQSRPTYSGRVWQFTCQSILQRPTYSIYDIVREHTYNLCEFNVQMNTYIFTYIFKYMYIYVYIVRIHCTYIHINCTYMNCMKIHMYTFSYIRTYLCEYMNMYIIYSYV